MISKKAVKLVNHKRWFTMSTLYDKSCVTSTYNSINNQNYYNLAAHNLFMQQCINNNNIRQFHTSNQKFGYYTTELKFARKVLGNSEINSDSLAKPFKNIEDVNKSYIENLIAKKWISMTNAEILENFELISLYAQQNIETESLENPKYRGIMEILSKRCQDFDDDEIYHLMSCLSLWWVQKEEPVFQSIYKVIDSECTKRMENWSVDKILTTNDYFYRLRISRVSEFTWNSLKKLKFKFKQMSPAQLVHFAFLLKLNRKIPINLYNFEYYVEQSYDKFTIDELGVIAMPFHKYMVPIRSKDLLIKLMQNLRSNIDTVSDITLSSLLKILRFINKDEIYKELELLFKTFESQISHRTLPTVSNIALFKSSVLIHDKNLMLEIMKRYEKEMKDAPIGDISKVLLTVTTFNYNAEKTKFYSTVESELLDSRRAEEIDRQPYHLLRSVENMLYVNYCPEKTLQRVMDPEFIKKMSDDNIWNLKANYLLIDNCLELEHHQYKGPRLDRETKNFLIERHGAIKEKIIHRYNKIQNRGKIMNDIIDHLQQVLNTENAIYQDSLLPYLPLREIILCYDSEEKKYLPPNEKLCQIPKGVLKYAPDDGKKWYVILVGTFNLVARNTCYPTGFMGMHMRHLNKIGYETILIPNQKWIRFTNNGKEKRNYLTNVLNNEIR